VRFVRDLIMNCYDPVEKFYYQLVKNYEAQGNTKGSFQGQETPIGLGLASS